MIVDYLLEMQDGPRCAGSLYFCIFMLFIFSILISLFLYILISLFNRSVKQNLESGNMIAAEGWEGTGC
jgi:hypothetical protein